MNAKKLIVGAAAAFALVLALPTSVLAAIGPDYRTTVEVSVDNSDFLEARVAVQASLTTADGGESR
jgi:hypothetical protein